MNRTTPLILAVALFMENMDSTVIATALPAIARDLGTSPIALKLALTAYLVALAVFIPISGWMADRFGAKKVFRIAIGVFVVGSILCAVANSLGFIVLARVIQGAGGAMMTPVARLLLVRSTDKRELVSAMAWLTIPGLIGPMLGPPVGGFITTFVSWHWIFLINVPIGILGIALSGRFLPDTPPIANGGVDWTGFVLSALAASGIVFGLSVVSLPALPPAIGILTLAVGIVSAWAYIRHARRRENPLLDLSLFRNPTFRASINGGVLFRIGNGATPFLLPLLLQLGFGLTPFQSGSITFVSAMGAIVMKFVARRALRTLGFRTVLVLASVTGAAFVAACGFFSPETPIYVMMGVLFFSGFFRSLFFTLANALVFADIGERDASQATALSASFQQVSIALGVAVAGGILEGMTLLTGEPINLHSFFVAFILVSAITATAALPFLFMPPDAGQNVSGHKGRMEDANARVQAVV